MRTLGREMTVAELIDALSGLDPMTPVVMSDDDESESPIVRLDVSSGLVALRVEGTPDTAREAELTALRAVVQEVAESKSKAVYAVKARELVYVA